MILQFLKQTSREEKEKKERFANLKVKISKIIFFILKVSLFEFVFIISKCKYVRTFGR